jgi:hypothetical protein
MPLHYKKLDFGPERIVLHKVGDGNPITQPLKNLCFSHVKDTSLECKSSYNSVCRIFLFVISCNTQKFHCKLTRKLNYTCNNIDKYDTKIPEWRKW